MIFKTRNANLERNAKPQDRIRKIKNKSPYDGDKKRTIENRPKFMSTVRLPKILRTQRKKHDKNGMEKLGTKKKSKITPRNARK